MKFSKRYFLIAAIAGFFGCTNKTPAKDFSGYQPAEGKVSYVYGGAIRTKRGYTDPGYRVVYTPPGTDKPLTVDAKLVLKDYEKGETVPIFYNPANPADVVTDVK
ncbi:DUF3592 domain-containing protein [Terrimonas ferruginea]|jgi:hypothetical protein|uniref:DUF3592 domain-containing protein n=1 Tax=Terrimonas ferruginea TaxID=249 RepID=UPI0003FB04A7|nr:hypothetical protein [Terrimonas ferruginea]